MNSAMVVTEPLHDDVWDAIGWQGSELLGDHANAYCYAQRTADGRIALGGRGIPYRFGSRTDIDGRTQDWTIESLTQTLHALFPATHDVRIEHVDDRCQAARRVERVLWNDPATGVMRHADAGYEIAIDCAREQGLDLPMVKA